ncbi:acyltransferase [Paenibacillus sp. LjRoot153]|uniref:acyltransferase family protein n=1 Tax=Paenibacillus sp. LjRoot153 TaxID=3342270 RepID=UPI003ED14FFD
MNSRFEQLDSLRGLSALTVVFGHLLAVLPIMLLDTGKEKKLFFINILKYSPLHTLWSGHEAVLLFFILSGFVLSLPYFNGIKTSYLNYLIKRFFRIYSPYFFALIVGILCRDLFKRSEITDLSDWFNGLWGTSTTNKLLFNHFSLVFLGKYDSDAFNPVIWSLVHEMRISLIFPFLMLFILRFNWKYSLLIGLSLSLISFTFEYLYPTENNNILLTVHYTFMFIIGALLAKHRMYLVETLYKLKRIKKCAILLMGLLLYSFPHLPVLLLSSSQIYVKICTNNYFNEWVACAGAAIFLLISISSNIAKTFLTFKPIIYLGKISYSTYLYHLIILFTLINILYGRLNILLIWILTILITCIISSFSYYLVEIPSSKLSKRLINALEKQSKVVGRKV